VHHERVNTYRLNVYCQIAGWLLLFIAASLPLGLDGDSRGWLMFFLLLPLLAALPGMIPALWRSTGRVSWMLVAIVACPAIAATFGVALPFAVRSTGWSFAHSWQHAMETFASFPLQLGVVGAPVLFLLPLSTWLVRRWRKSA
jgi:hypothetical protein